MSGTGILLHALLAEDEQVLTTEDGVTPLEGEWYFEFFGPDMRFLIVELDVYKPGSATTVTLAEGRLSHPHLALAEQEDHLETSAQILASDLGYRSMVSDPNGIVPYPPVLDQAFQVDNKVNLDPANSAVAATWGAISLSNADDQYDALAATYNSDGRDIKIKTGLKLFDRTRQYHQDPDYGSLQTMWSGVATPWFLSDVALTIPVRDATYWLERLYQASVYGGTGGYDGTQVLTGKPLPRTRGGTATDPIRNITPTLVDPINRIYQYSDAPGTVVNLYEGAAAVFTYRGDTNNLYAGNTPSGQYRTDNSRALFQLGSNSVHTITADVTGQFPVAGAVTTFAALAQHILTEDMELPPSMIDLASFAAVDAAYPYIAGGYYDSTGGLTGVDVVNHVISGPGCKLIAKRDGRLGLFMLRALSPGAVPVTTFDLSNIVTITPVALPGTLDPPPYRIRSEFAHNFTLQTSDLNGASATTTQQQFVGMTGSFATWSSTTVLTAFRRPNDPAPITGLLLRIEGAQAVVNDLGLLWGVRRRLYDVTVPSIENIARDIGDIVSIAYPMDDLQSGRLGQIVGYSFRSPDSATTMRVLV
jgi:hypothetical protein